ncbi:hypothetical protein F4819DRAFT_339134 [Hypoxylon fuscum]|nr:hypothetical protein F4819DRAFT_339134 [Hypoxylon fuscum]
MYIPQTSSLDPGSTLAPAPRLGEVLVSADESTRYHNAPFPVELVLFLASWLFARGLDAFSVALDHASSLRKRSDADNVNTTIGVVVGILLAVFAAGFLAFFYFYGKSMRFTKKKHRRRKSSGSKTSKDGGGGGGGDPPPPT